MWKKIHVELEFWRLEFHKEISHTKTETQRTPEQKHKGITNKSEETRRNNKSKQQIRNPKSETHIQTQIS